MSFCFILSSHGSLRVTPTRLFGYKYTIIFPRQDTLKLLLTDIRYFFFKTDRSHVVLYNLQSKKQPKNLEVTNIQRILADDKLHSAKYSSKLDILHSICILFAPSTNESAQGASQGASITTKGGHNRRQALVIY